MSSTEKIRNTYDSFIIRTVLDRVIDNNVVKFRAELLHIFL